MLSDNDCSCRRKTARRYNNPTPCRNADGAAKDSLIKIALFSDGLTFFGKNFQVYIREHFAISKVNFIISTLTYRYSTALNIKKTIFQLNDLGTKCRRLRKCRLITLYPIPRPSSHRVWILILSITDISPIIHIKKVKQYYFFAKKVISHNSDNIITVT